MVRKKSSSRYIIGSLFLHLFVVVLLMLTPEHRSKFLHNENLLAPPAEQKIALISLGNYQQQATPTPQQAPTPPSPQQAAQQQEPPPQPLRELQAKRAKEVLEKVTTEERMPDFGKKAAAIVQEKKKSARRTVTPEELTKLARLALTKEKPPEPLPQQQSRTDFFRHAAFVAAQPPAQAQQGPEGRISGLASLKQYSYEARLRDALLSAFNTVKHRLPRPDPMSVATSGQCGASVNLVINKDGSIAELDLVTSSGDLRFDRLVLESIKYAAPFPSIPDHLGIDKFRLGAMQLSVNY